jgi:hypothetical protein
MTHRGGTASIRSDHEAAIRNFGAAMAREAKVQADRLTAAPADTVIDAAIGLPAALTGDARACLGAVQKVLYDTVGEGEVADEVYKAHEAVFSPVHSRLMAAARARGLRPSGDALYSLFGAVGLVVLATPSVLAECPPALRERCAAVISLLPKVLGGRGGVNRM